MNKKIAYLLVVGLLHIVAFSYAQDTKPIMKFENKVFDFGTFKEEDGKVTHIFEFVNDGKEPIIINQVRASCGCTSPEWSHNPVAPNKKGFVKVTYNPLNRPGPFHKSITITANTETPVHVLKITGKVTPRVKKTTQDLYPRKMGGLLLKDNHLSFTKIKNTKTKENSLPIINDSDEPIKLTFKQVPSHITIKSVPETLQPKEKGNIIATYDASKKQDWGFVIDYLTVVINDEFNPNNRLIISANIEEDFSNLSEKELALAPKVEFNEKVFNFGEITQGKKIEHSFIMSNTGKTDLIIRKTKASCGCTTISLLKEVIKPGEKTEIKVMFDSRGKLGRQNKLITIITNDPEATSVRLRITGNVLNES